MITKEEKVMYAKIIIMRIKYIIGGDIITAYIV